MLTDEDLVKMDLALSFYENLGTAKNVTVPIAELRQLVDEVIRTRKAMEDES